MSQQIYSLVLNYNCAGQFCSNVLHWQFEDSGYSSTYAAAAALISRWKTLHQATLLALLPDAVTLLSYRSRRISAAGGFEATDVVAGGTTGGRSGTMPVAACGAVIILFETANGTKRGRMFLPGISESDCQQGVIGDSYHIDLVAGAAAMFGNMVLVGGGTPTARSCIWSSKTKTAVIADHFYPSATIGTLRRRQVPV